MVLGSTQPLTEMNRSISWV